MHPAANHNVCDDQRVREELESRDDLDDSIMTTTHRCEWHARLSTRVLVVIGKLF